MDRKEAMRRLVKNLLKDYSPKVTREILRDNGLRITPEAEEIISAAEKS